jgi:thiol-disulfide isomerase/thioredoxin
MIRTAVGFMGLLILLSALQGQDKSQTPTPVEQYQALDKEYRKASEDFRKALADAETREEKQKVVQQKAPYPEDFAQRFMELAEKNPNDPAAVDALVWIVTHRMYRDQQSKDTRRKAFQIVLRDHVQNEKMAALYPALGHVMAGYARDKQSQQLLHAVLEKNKHRRAQALACLALAEQAEGCQLLAREFKDNPVRANRYQAIYGKEAVDTLVKATPDELSKEAKSFYERFSKDFADVAVLGGNKLGETAKKSYKDGRALFVGIGNPAPQIDDEDIDGKQFKLSDYRGKVVLLDFWGHWCGPCRAMYAHERSLVKRLEGKPFVLLGVNSDKDRDELKKVLVKEEITWRSFWNGGGTSGPISRRWVVSGWPTLILIDAKGVIRHKYLGSPGEKTLDEEIDKLIAEVEKTAAK